jgi:hypothetical protein
VDTTVSILGKANTMPRIYTLRQKKHALYLIRQFDSIAVVSHQTGIPERTLRDWYDDRYSIAATKNPALDYEGSTGSISAVELRDRLLEQIEKLTRNASDDPRKAYFTSLAIDHLLVQIKALNDTVDVPQPPDLPDDPPADPVGSKRKS